MKIVRITVLMLSLSLLLSFIGCGASQKTVTAFNEEADLLPLTADGDGWLSYNPDRGFRSGTGFSVGELAKLGSDEKISNAVYKTLDNYVFRLHDNTKVINISYNLSAYNKSKKLPDEALNVIRITGDLLRLKGYKQSVNFVYNSSYHVAYTVSEEARKNIESVSASEEIMLSHIEQLAPVMKEYKDTVFSVMGGFIGFSGDMAESSQYPPVDRNRIMKAVMEKLVVPLDTYYLIRTPSNKYDFEKAYPDYKESKRISFVNKSMFGVQTKLGWNSGGYQKGNPENDPVDWWEYVTEQAAFAPNDGEIFPNSNLIGKGSHPTPRIMTGLEIILECAHHSLTTMGFWNGYYEVDRTKESPAVMDLWQEQAITPEILNENKIVYDPAWFLDDNGETAARNTFQFIRDHLGYKLVGEKFKASSDGKTIKASLSLKNYGFSAAFNIKSGFALLDADYNIISRADAGEPNEWYSHDPKDPTSTAVPTYTAEAELSAPETAGEYHIAFYLKNSMDDGAALSNREVPFENGMNILYTFKTE